MSQKGFKYIFFKDSFRGKTLLVYFKKIRCRKDFSLVVNFAKRSDTKIFK